MTKHGPLLGAFVATPGTWGLLGVGQLLGWSREWSSNPEPGMDAITWMGVAAWKWGGAGAFVLFTGGGAGPRSVHSVTRETRRPLTSSKTPP